MVPRSLCEVCFSYLRSMGLPSFFGWLLKKYRTAGIIVNCEDKKVKLLNIFVIKLSGTPYLRRTILVSVRLA